MVEAPSEDAASSPDGESFKTPERQHAQKLPACTPSRVEKPLTAKDQADYDRLTKSYLEMEKKALTIRAVQRLGSTRMLLSQPSRVVWANRVSACFGGNLLELWDKAEAGDDAAARRLLGGLRVLDDYEGAEMQQAEKLAEVSASIQAELEADLLRATRDASPPRESPKPVVEIPNECLVHRTIRADLFTHYFRTHPL